jgi:hypothetical protein
VGGSFGPGENSPAIVVPIDDEMCISKEADDERDEEGWY